MTKRPGWATAVGVTGMIWGTLGALKGLALIFSGELFQLMHKKEMTTGLNQAMDTAATAPRPLADSVAAHADSLRMVVTANREWVSGLMRHEAWLILIVALLMIFWSVRMLKMHAASRQWMTVLLTVDLGLMVVRAWLRYYWMQPWYNVQGLRAQYLTGLVIEFIPTLLVSLILLGILRANGKNGFDDDTSNTVI